MSKKSTILSEKESTLIETLIAKYGLVINFKQIYTELKNIMSRQQARNLISKLSKNGWLVRIKKGMYYITSLESRGTADISAFAIAQILLHDSYISLEAALQHHGIFDQYLRTITSITLKKHKTTTIQGLNYKFIKTDKKFFYGFRKVRIEGRMVSVATLEKAILDLLHFDRSVYSIDLVLKRLEQHQDMFNWKRLDQYSKGQSITVQRIAGFLLEKSGLDTAYIYNLVKNKKGCSYMTKDSKNFNAKWRLYYHDHFV